MMQRRGFLGAMLAAAAAPAFVRAGSLMRVNTEIIAAPSVIAPISSIIAPGHSMRIGDRFTIAGLAGMFQVTEMVDSSISVLQVSGG